MKPSPARAWVLLWPNGWMRITAGSTKLPRAILDARRAGRRRSLMDGASIPPWGTIIQTRSSQELRVFYPHRVGGNRTLVMVVRWTRAVLALALRSGVVKKHFILLKSQSISPCCYKRGDLLKMNHLISVKTAACICVPGRENQDVAHQRRCGLSYNF